MKTIFINGRPGATVQDSDAVKTVESLKSMIPSADITIIDHLENSPTVASIDNSQGIQVTEL